MHLRRKQLRFSVHLQQPETLSHLHSQPCQYLQCLVSRWAEICPLRLQVAVLQVRQLQEDKTLAHPLLDLPFHPLLRLLPATLDHLRRGEALSARKYRKEDIK